MSLEMMEKAWEQDLKPLPKIALLALADYADADHRCWPYYVMMEKKTGLNRHQLERAYQELMDSGLIEVRHYINDNGSVNPTLNVFRLFPESY